MLPHIWQRSSLIGFFIASSFTVAAHAAGATSVEGEASVDRRAGFRLLRAGATLKTRQPRRRCATRQRHNRVCFQLRGEHPDERRRNRPRGPRLWFGSRRSGMGLAIRAFGQTSNLRQPQIVEPKLAENELLGGAAGVVEQPKCLRAAVVQIGNHKFN